MVCLIYKVRNTKIIKINNNLIWHFFNVLAKSFVNPTAAPNVPSIKDGRLFLVKPGQVEDAINNLDAGKSCGLDGIYSEHLKYSSIGYRILIAKCMTSFLVHGQLPESLMSVVLVPIIKDKSGKINSKDNYRPIAIASIMSKLIEKLLLERLSNFFINQSASVWF